MQSSLQEITTIYLSKVTVSPRPGDISTHLEGLGLVGHECKQVYTKLLIFTLSFADHSYSFLDIILPADS